MSDAACAMVVERGVDIMHLGRAHTAGDAVVWVTFFATMSISTVRAQSSNTCNQSARPERI